MCAMISCKNETEKKEDNPDMAATDYLPTDDMTPEEDAAWQIAKANGAENWDKVKEVHFTFNVDRNGNHMERSWVWKPQTEDITMMTPQDTVSYNQKAMDSLQRTSDKGFINDAYWLLAPMHLVWDRDATIKVQDTATAPISKEKMHKITLTYADKGGYTPGDAYDFFYDDQNMIQEWIYRKGDATEPSMITTWEDYEDYNGIKIAKTHNGADGGVKLYFTNIDVKTK